MNNVDVSSLSKEQLFFYKVKTDRKWYIENFLQIKTKSADIVPFKTNEAQQIVLKHFEEDDRVGKPKRYIILKARQMGMSTLVEGIIFHDTANNENKNALIVAHEEPASQNLFNMSKLFYDMLPAPMKPMKRYSNGKVLSFENPDNDDAVRAKNPGLKSKISIATAGTGEVGRSSTIHSLHVSELAFFPDARTTMLGLLQSVPDTPNSIIVLESTANGVGDYFHNFWQKAVKGENEYTPIFLPWFTDPGYTRPFRTRGERENFITSVDTPYIDGEGKQHETYEYALMKKYNLTYEQLNWRKYTIENKCEGEIERFMQEYPSTPEEAFIATGRPRFDRKSLREYQNITKPPIMRGYLIEKDGEVVWREDDKGYISIWKKPENGVNYSIGADVAEGLANGDYSCGLVGTNDSFDVVAKWHGHIDPDLFGNELVKLAKYYNNAYIGVESNNHGLTTLTTIKKLEYWNIYFSKTFDKISDTYTTKMGWQTTSRTKPLMIDKLAEFIREKYLGIYSDLIISEMFTYIRNDKGGTEAQEGCHDDTVMALGILLQLLLEGRDDNYTPEIPWDEERRIIYDVVDELFEKEVGTVEYSQ